MNEIEFNQINADKIAEIIPLDNTIATNTCVVNTSIVNADTKYNRACPHCGASYYMENYSTRTCMYYPPIYKDGVNINPDRNKTTTHCTCITCGKEFSFQE
jgi:hypothetical protein